MGTGRRPRNGRVANQPLGFDSLTLCSHSTNLLDFAAARVMLELFRGRRLVSRSLERCSGLWLFGTFRLGLKFRGESEAVCEWELACSSLPRVVNSHADFVRD